MISLVEDSDNDVEVTSIVAPKRRRISTIEKGDFLGKGGTLSLGTKWDRVQPIDWAARGGGRASTWYTAGSDFGHQDLLQVFNVVLLCDKREMIKLRATLDKKKEAFCANLASLGLVLQVEDRDLKVGDYMWVLRHKHQANVEYVLDYVMERKTYTDLWSSITKPGTGSTMRYNEQKRRMIYSGISNRFYLVEGQEADLVENSHTLHSKEAKSSTINGTKVQSLLDGFNLLSSLNPAETVDKLLSLTRQIALKMRHLTIDDWIHSPAHKNVLFEELHSQVSINKRTVTEMSAAMLYQTAGAGKKTVEDVFKRYTSLAGLMEALEPYGGQPEKAAAELTKTTGLPAGKARMIADLLVNPF